MLKHLQELLEENGYFLSSNFAEIYYQMMPEGPWEGGIPPRTLRYLVLRMDESKTIYPVTSVSLNNSTGEDHEYQEFLTRLPTEECWIFLVNWPDLSMFGPLEGIYIPEAADEEEKKRYSHNILDFLAQIAVRGSKLEEFQKSTFERRVQSSIDAELNEKEDFEN